MFEIKQTEDRVILVAVCVDSEAETQASLHELAELARTAGASVAATVVQNRESVHPGTYLGKGKIEELREMLYMLDANGIICDDELSPAQMNNLEQALECKVMDRTLLILDIFAGRARTSEGKIQVELAQLKYRQARLVGLRSSLSRLGGGIGTRGPGEKKLEMDRRLITDRIGALRKELEEVKRHRDVIREGRNKGTTKVAAIVGYTNAGKSTLLNTLTKAGVLEEDALFATLDPTTRILDLPGGTQILLTDTVGFIRKLPHHLINAFRSTLEEAIFADLIIHVVDASNPQMDAQMAVVYETLQQLGMKKKTIITLFNKQDKVTGEQHLSDPMADYTFRISAKNGDGLENLGNALEEILLKEQIYIERLYGYHEGGKIALIRQYGTLLSEEFLAEGTKIKAYVPAEIYGKV
ncbi:MAG: GTPase HflX [Lachnospiraceae bacterium]|nr:GTPase HflX [Lachnospiraceae bacterium]